MEPNTETAALHAEIREFVLAAQAAFVAGKEERALESLRSGAKRGTELGLMFETMVCLRDAAAICEALGRYPEALTHCEQGLLEAQLDTVSYCGLSLNKGVILLRMGQYGQAVKTFDAARARMSMVPPRLRTPEMHTMMDNIAANLDLSRMVLREVALGKTVEIE